MKILLTSPYPVLPANSGGAVRTLNLARALYKCSDEVHVLSASSVQCDERCPEIHFHGFEDKGTIGHFYNRSFKKALNKLLTEGFDLALAGFPYQAWMLVPAFRRTGVPFIYDAHNVEADRFKRMRRPFVASLVRATERHLSRAADRVITVSDQDRELLTDYYGVDSLVLSNGVDTEIMRPLDDSDTDSPLDTPYVLFFGGYDYPPNVEAARFLLEDVWPEARKAIPGTRLALVGRNPKEWMHGHEGVEVTGGVEDIVRVIQHAKVVVAPLFSGGGTRLKILEALACGKDILATPFGAMGIADQDSPALHLASEENFAARLVELVSRATNESPVNQDARKLAIDFDWLTLVKGAEPHLKQIAKQP